MQLNITARHLDLTPALSDYVHRKVEKADRYFDSIVWAQTILTVEKHRHIAEIVVHTPGNTFRVKETAGDLYSAIDLAAHKLDLHLSRLKEKKRGHRARISSKNFVPAEKIFNENPLLSNFLPNVKSDGQFSGTIAEVKRIFLKPQTVNEAMKKMSSNELPFLLFLNDRTNQVNVLYRKGKGTCGLLEVESAESVD